jgi:ribosomal protein S2
VEILQSNVPRDTSSDSLPKLSKQEELQLEQENQELLNELLGIEQQVK